MTDTPGRANEPPFISGRMIHGYKRTDVTCPMCGASYGMLETTADPAVVLYRCWCGATAKGRDD